ncbi:hypothetical protein ACFW20_07030 [Streptomyces nigra]|uniref:hypothetical protein n=1 Tax=Streptomyces nigra TaxID=1827580 RepID=UPI0036B65881
MNGKRKKVARDDLVFSPLDPTGGVETSKSERGGTMLEQRDALTELVKSQVGEGKRWSTREFAARAEDPETGYAPGKSLIAKIINDQGYNITAQLVSALAEGLGLPRSVVGAAAHLQLIGYTEEELTEGAPATLIRTLHAGGDTPKARAVAQRWQAEAQTEA